MITPTPKQKTNLLEWYQLNFRPLPWRKTRDPYAIWISETMLQQTTTQAVIPYFEKFMERFPSVKDLAAAPLEAVYERWAGLGYYSRARNLHKAAQILSAQGFPKTFEELILLPGLGPYTARAVSSLAFGQSVGVLDGNVIRVLCRVHGLKSEWWKTAERLKLQTLADQWVKNLSSSVMNQALMELGATICTPKSPSCLLCPLKKSCVALNENRVSALPLPKPRKAKEVWIWQPRIHKNSNRILLETDHQLPFLKNQAMPPGSISKSSQKPKNFDFRHSITHYDIYVHIDRAISEGKALKGKWVQIDELPQINPSSLLKKLLDVFDRADDRPGAHGRKVLK